MSNDNQNQYWSASKGAFLPISEMEQHHLNNAIIKLDREREAGSPYPVQVLDALKAEQVRRRDAERATGTQTQPTAPAPAPVAPAQESPLLSFTKELIALADDLRSGTSVSDDQLIQKLQKLANTVNGNKPAQAAPVTPAAPVTGPAIDTPLAQLPEDQYPTLTAAVLLNSLGQHGVTTVRDLGRLAASDFGAVRFSTVPAFVEATALLLGLGQTWAAESSILRVDGVVNRVINPNASAIGVFVSEAQSRLRPLVLRLQAGENTPVLCAAINRVFEGVKRRVALAAQVHSVVILARGGQSKEEIRRMADALPVSASMRHQIWLHLNRLASRLRRSDTAQVPVTA